MALIECRVCKNRSRMHLLLEFPASPNSAQGFVEVPNDVSGGVDLKIFQCMNCGIVQHLSDPVSYFKDVIRAVAYSPEMANFRRKQFKDWINQYDLQYRSIVEIGCGRGEYLNLLKESGGEHLYGIENSILNLEQAKNLGFDAAQGYLDDQFINPWPHNFDAFVILSFLEHWPEPRSALSSLFSLLNEGAIGLVEVPNFEYILENGMISEFTVDHIFYFTKSTLRTLLENNGFEVLNVDVIWHSYIISATVRKRNCLHTDGFLKIRDSFLRDFDKFLLNYSKEDVVIWGAGHQSLAVISIARLFDRVSHIVDSALFKQNRYTPGSNLLIKAPETLKEDRPLCLIIIAAAYSDEVYWTVRKEYDFINKIAIVRDHGLEVIQVER